MGKFANDVIPNAAQSLARIAFDAGCASASSGTLIHWYQGDALRPSASGSASLRTRLPFVRDRGLIAGTLPLIHVHSLLVLFVFGIFLLIADYPKQRQWIAFAVGVAAVAVPELLWSTTGSATRVSAFIGWHFGWDSGETNILWFWLKNTAASLSANSCGSVSAVSHCG
jgi:hypothetical protein